MDHYDALVIAGDEPYWLSRSLYDLSREVGIPAPHFYGNREYSDYNGGEKWHITTVGEDDVDEVSTPAPPIPTDGANEEGGSSTIPMVRTRGS